MLEFDGTENPGICSFNFAKESGNLQKMELGDLAEIPKQDPAGSAMTAALKRITKHYRAKHCKYFTSTDSS